MAQNIIHISDTSAKKPVLELNNYIVRSSVRSFSQESKNSGLSVKYVIRGQEDYRIDGKKHLLSSGQFLVVNKGQEIECQLNGNQPIEGLCMYLDDSLLLKRIKEMGLSNEELLAGNQNESPIPEFKSLVYTADTNDLGKFAIRVSKSLDGLDDFGTGAFFYQIADELIKHQQGELRMINQITRSKKSTREEIHRRITESINYIHSYFHRDLSIPELARVSCMSEFHFLRCFKSLTGTTPHQFISRLRLEKAAELLALETISASDVAYAVGFHDASSFGRIFKKKYQLSPIQYRKKLA